MKRLFGDNEDSEDIHIIQMVDLLDSAISDKQSMENIVFNSKENPLNSHQCAIITK